MNDIKIIPLMIEHDRFHCAAAGAASSSQLYHPHPSLSYQQVCANCSCAVLQVELSTIASIITISAL
jgi:hypothetical protein